MPCAAIDRVQVGVELLEIDSNRLSGALYCYRARNVVGGSGCGDGDCELSMPRCARMQVPRWRHKAEPLNFDTSPRVRTAISMKLLYVLDDADGNWKQRIATVTRKMLAILSARFIPYWLLGIIKTT
jgi:hypothetical protein